MHVTWTIKTKKGLRYILAILSCFALGAISMETESSMGLAIGFALVIAGWVFYHKLRGYLRRVADGKEL